MKQKVKYMSSRIEVGACDVDDEQWPFALKTDCEEFSEGINTDTQLK